MAIDVDVCRCVAQSEMLTATALVFSVQTGVESYAVDVYISEILKIHSIKFTALCSEADMNELPQHIINEIIVCTNEYLNKH